MSVKIRAIRVIEVQLWNDKTSEWARASDITSSRVIEILGLQSPQIIYKDTLDEYIKEEDAFKGGSCHA